MENIIYKIFELKKYKSLKNNIKCFESKDINIIINELKNNKGYHLNLFDDQNYILFGDIDHCESRSILTNILNDIINFFNLDESLLSFTISKNKDNEYGSHWSYPLLYCNLIQMKSYIKSFKTKFNNYKKYIDLSIYSDNRWFRLPMQTNDDKPNIHKIISGNASDFILNFINNNATKLELNINQNEEMDINENIISSKNTEKIKFLLHGLSYDRYNYNDWFIIGAIIYNESNDIEIFKDWSKAYKKYDLKELKDKWQAYSTSNNNKATIKTLIKMVKEDNPDYYDKYKDKFNKKPEFNFKQKITTSKIADHFKTIYGNKFIYQNNKLYYYNGIYWKYDNDEKYISLNKIISDEYYNYLIKLLENEEKKDLKNIEDDKKELIAKLYNTSRLNLTDLLNYNKRQNYINEIIIKLYDDSIKFDENNYLFAFNNKVFDLKENKFIEPKPEFYISITTGYNYIDQDEIENIKVIDNLLITIFPDEDIRNFYLCLLSTCLDGVPLEKFILANGSGGNGKGLLHEFMMYMIGNYSYVLPVNILLNDLKNGSNPELANMNKKRMIIAREPDQNKTFNCATIKEITGGDQINARLNFSNDTKTNLNLSFFLECNQKPKLNEVNDALSRRILDIPFKNKFVDETNYNLLDEEDKKTTFLINQYYKTNEFKDQYKQALFLILVKHYKIYNDNKRNLNIPKEIIKRNNEYLQNSDHLLSWFNDNYEKTDNIKDIIKLKDVYNNYKTSNYFNNLNKLEKRNDNYKNFTEKMETNKFLKKYVINNNHDTYIIKNHIIKNNNTNDDDEYETKSPLDF